MNCIDCLNWCLNLMSNLCVYHSSLINLSFLFMCINLKIEKLWNLELQIVWGIVEWEKNRKAYDLIVCLKSQLHSEVSLSKTWRWQIQIIMTGITSGYPTANYTIFSLFTWPFFYFQHSLSAGAFESYAPSLLHIYLFDSRTS